MLELFLLESMHRPGAGSLGGSVELAWRGPRRIGEDVKIEISLGAMADPIELLGKIQSVNPTNNSGTMAAKIEVMRRYGHRLAYVTDVLRGQRAATLVHIPASRSS